MTGLRALFISLLSALFIAQPALATRLPASINLAQPVNAQTVRIFGVSTEDRAGTSISGADVNGDGYEDAIIGSPTALGGRGVTAVVFGTAAFAAKDTVNLSSGSSGVLRILGKSALDWSGFSTATGDVNGDGFKDIVIGAYQADALGRVNSGEVYVVFGSATLGSQSYIDLSGTPSNVLSIHGTAPGDGFGYSVATGRVNGDAYDDIVIGAYLADTSERVNAGITYVIYGSAGMKTLGTLDSATMTSGITRILGANTGDLSGSAVCTGDFDNDSFSDVVIGAPEALGSRGGAFVVFGASALQSTSSIDLNPFSTNVVKVFGRLSSYKAGTAVAAGDLNGDGLHDLAIGSPGGGPAAKNEAGEVEIIFGEIGFRARGVMYIGEYPVINTIRLYGAMASGRSGSSLTAGDVNGDNRRELIIGAPAASPQGRTAAGALYVFSGATNLTTVGAVDLAADTTAVSSRIWGAAEGERYGAAVGAVDLNGDGLKEVIGGIPYAAPWGKTNAGGARIVMGLNAPKVLSVNPRENGFTGTSPEISGVFNTDITWGRTIVEKVGYGFLADSTSWSESKVTSGVPRPFNRGDRIRVRLDARDSEGSYITQKEWFFDVKTDDIPPRLLSDSPSSGEVNVSPSANVTIMFSGDVKSDSTTVTVTGKNSRVITMARTWADSVLTLVNSSSFLLNETVTVTLSAADRYGDRAQYSFSFTTRPEVTPPSVTVRVPGNPLLLPKSAYFRIFFPIDINKSTVSVTLNGNITGSISGTGVWADTVYTFTPSADLRPDETLVLSVNAEDIYKNALSGWTAVYAVKPDETPPTITTRTPAADEKLVSPYAPVSITYSTDVNRDSTSVSIVSRRFGSWVLTRSWTDYTVTLTPYAPYRLGDTLTVTTDMGDSYANRSIASWAFIVRSDSTPPYFTVTSPGNPNLMGKNEPIILIFPADIDTSTVMTSLKNVLGVSIPGLWQWTGRKYTFTPTNDYPLGYALTLAVDAADSCRNAIPHTLTTFTVKPDTVPPSILSHVPASYAAGVLSSQPVIVRFSGDVWPDSTTIALKSDIRGYIAINKSWTDSTLTVYPQSAFQTTEIMTVTVNAGDRYSNRKTTVWSFTAGPKYTSPYTVTTPGIPSLLRPTDPLVVKYRRTVDMTTVSATVTGKTSGAVAGTWAISDTVYTFTPSPGYTPGDSVTVIARGRDFNGDSIPETPAVFRVRPDTAPPVVVYRDPSPDTSNVPPSRVSIVARFTGDISRDSTTVRVTGENGRIIGLATSWSDSTLTLINSGLFHLGEAVTVTVNAGDVYANRATYSWSFTVRPETTPPTVSISTVSDMTLLRRMEPIRLIFSGDVDSTSVIVSINGSMSGAVGGSWTWTDSVYVFTPAGYSLGETLTLSIEASDIHLNVMQKLISTMQVRPDETAPSLVSRSPGSGETNVLPGGNIVMTFSDDTIPDSTTVVVTGAGGRVITPTRSWSNSALTLVNSGSLFRLGETVTVAVNAGDRYANRAQYLWSFTVRPETDPPVFRTVSSYFLRTGDPIVLVFPGDVDHSAVRTVLAGSLSGTVSGAWDWTDSTYTFTPRGYQPGETLTLTVNATDIHLNAIPETIRSFLVITDDIAPSILSRYPSAGETNVHPSRDIVVTFTSDAIDDSVTVSVTGTGGRTISMERSWSNGALTLKNSVNIPLFRSGETIAVKVRSADINGNAMNDTWSFFIRPELNPPVFEVIPVGDPANLAADSPFTLSFPADVDTSRVSFVLTGTANGRVAGTLAWIGTELTFKPTALYPLGETLTMTVNAVDIHGNAIPETKNIYTVGEHTPRLTITAVEPSDSTAKSYHIRYTVADPDDNMTLTRNWQYSVDYGTWVSIDANAISGNNARLPGDGEVVWTPGPNLTGVFSTGMRIRMEVFDGRFTSGYRVSPLFALDRNEPPEISIKSATVDDASGKIVVAYIVTDTEKNDVSLSLQYSSDNGRTWKPGTPDRDLSDIVQSKYTGTFGWAYSEGLSKGIDYTGVRVRVTVADYTTGETAEYGPLRIDLNDPPTVTLTDLFSTQSGDVSIQYHIADAESDTVRFNCFYSTNDGASWNATANVVGVANLISPDGSIVWHSWADLPSIQSFTVRFRAVPSDHDQGTGDDTASFQLFNNSPPAPTVSVPDTSGITIPIVVSVTDSEKDKASIHVAWSRDGIVWKTARVAGDTLGIASGSPPDTLYWDAKTDLGAGFFNGVKIGVTAADALNPMGSPQLVPAVRTITVDNAPPVLASVYGFAGADTLYIRFDERIESPSALDAGNYTVSGNLHIARANKGASADRVTLVLETGSKLPEESVTVAVRSVTDRFGNVSGALSQSFVPDDANVNPTISLDPLPPTVSGNVAIHYHIVDPEHDTVTLAASFSTDGGANWRQASTSGATGNIGFAGYGGTFTWISSTDLPGRDIEGVMLRVVARDNQDGPAAVTGPFRVDNNAPPAAKLKTSHPDSVYAGTVPMGYTLTDAEGDTLFIEPSWSANGDSTWKAATVTGALAGIVPAIYAGTLQWNTAVDLPNHVGPVTFRLIARDRDASLPDTITVKIDNYGVSSVAFTLPQGEIATDILANYTIRDGKNRDVTLKPSYSRDGGSWIPATVTGTITNISSASYKGSLIWLSSVDLKGFEGRAFFRLIPDNGREGYPEVGSVTVDYNQPPVIVPGEIPSKVTGDVTLPFAVNDAENDSVAVAIEYSIDGGKNWYQAETGGTHGKVPGDGSQQSAVWLSMQDLPGRDITNVFIRMAAADADTGAFVSRGPFRVDDNLPPSVKLVPVSPDSIYEETVEIRYTLSDSERNMLSFDAAYSLNGGILYTPATVIGKTSGIFSDSYSSTIQWNLSTDLADKAGEAILRIIPRDADAGAPDSVRVRFNTFGIARVALTAPSEEQKSDVSIAYDITDLKQHAVSLGLAYSTNGGTTWALVAATPDIMNIPSSRYRGSFVWKGKESIAGFKGEVLLRVTPDNGFAGQSAIVKIKVDYNEPPSIRSVKNNLSSIYSGDMAISFDAYDAEGDSIHIAAWFSIDGGTTYKPATLRNTTVSPSTAASILWSTFTDLGYVNDMKVHLRLHPADADSGAIFIAGPFTVTNLVGDFDNDLAIDGLDLPGFSRAWKNRDLSREMGPASGEPPYMTVHPDGRMDFEDLSVFVMMWNWYSGYAAAKPALAAKPASGAAPVAGNTPVRFVPGGDGTVAAVADGPVDYLRIVVTAEGTPLDAPSFTSTGYWTEGNRGIVLSRGLAGGGFEAAAALLDGSPKQDGRSEPLGVLKLGDVTGNVTIRSACRLSPDGEIIESETVLAAAEVFARPAEFMLMQNAPNPFNPSTVIRFALPEAAHVRLLVYTITGQKAAVLKDDFMPAGYHEIRWDAAGFPSGTYFYSCRAGSFEKTQRMLLLK